MTGVQSFWPFGDALQRAPSRCLLAACYLHHLQNEGGKGKQHRKEKANVTKRHRTFLLWIDGKGAAARSDKPIAQLGKEAIRLNFSPA